MTFDARQTEAFLSVVEQGSFDQAAAQLHLTQSAVSQRVRALEARIGKPLIVRARPCRPTTDGQRLLQYLRRIRLLEAEAEADFAGKAAGPVSISLAVNADTLGTWLLPALADFLIRESVLVDVIVDDQAHTYTLLEAGLALGCVSAEPQPMRGCTVEPLGAMRYRLMASPAFQQRWFPKGMTRDAARQAPVLTFNRKDTLQSDFLQARLGLPPDAYPSHYIPATEPFLTAIRLGLGYGMVPDVQSRQHGDLLARGELVDLAPDHPVDVALYWHAWKVQSPLFERLSRVLVARGREVLA